jgi:hypothetical protein
MEVTSPGIIRKTEVLGTIQKPVEVNKYNPITDKLEKEITLTNVPVVVQTERVFLIKPRSPQLRHMILLQLMQLLENKLLKIKN